MSDIQRATKLFYSLLRFLYDGRRMQKYKCIYVNQNVHLVWHRAVFWRLLIELPPVIVSISDYLTYSNYYFLKYIFLNWINHLYFGYCFFHVTDNIFLNQYLFKLFKSNQPYIHFISGTKSLSEKNLDAPMSTTIKTIKTNAIFFFRKIY